MYLGYINVIKADGGLGWATTTETAPNDMSGCVIWAISMFLLRVFMYTNNLFTILGMRKVQVGEDNQNEPKRRQMHCLGPRCVFFFSTLFCNHLLYIYFISILLLN